MCQLVTRRPRNLLVASSGVWSFGAVVSAATAIVLMLDN